MVKRQWKRGRWYLFSFSIKKSLLFLLCNNKAEISDIALRILSEYFLNIQHIFHIAVF